MSLSSKRGVSPLIATVLLIAFAVSLGAVVMNWTSASLSSSEESFSGENSDICKDISIKILDSDGLCLDRNNNKIILNIENGPIEINGIRLSYLANNGEYIDKKQQIPAGVIGHIEFNYDPILKGELKTIKIIPFTTIGSERIQCIDKSISKNLIKDC